MLLRILLGFPFVYLISGFPLARLLLPEEKTISLKLILTSFACSLFLTYPAAVLTTMLEGQSAAAIYSVHLPHSLLSLALIFLLTFLVLMRGNKNWWKLSLPKLTWAHVVLALIIGLYSFFVFWNLGRADVVGDDYDLGYQAYNLHSGILAARKAYIISFDTHPPLMMTIKHFGMQLFSPWGLPTLEDWMFRGVEGMMGLGIILAAYLLIREFISEKAALVAALLLAVNNYMIFFGRYFEREVYAAFFMVLAAYFFLVYSGSNKRRDLLFGSFLIGCGLLVKVSSIILIPVIVYLLLRKKRLAEIGYVGLVILITYLPVIIFNIGAYVLTGYMDSTFSRFFGINHPWATGIAKQPYLVNPPTLVLLLADYYGLPVLLFFLACTVYVFWKLRASPVAGFTGVWILAAILFFAFSPMRAYYLLIFTIPLIIFVALASKPMFRGIVGKLLFAGIIGYSFVYSYRSNLVSHRVENKYYDIGSGGEYELLLKNLGRTDFSLAAAVFSPEEGWKTFRERLDLVYKPGDCLELAQPSLDLPVRRYLETHDLVRQALQGPNYKPAYPMCEDTTGNKIVIYYDGMGQVNIR